MQRLDKRDVIFPFSPKLIEGGPIRLLEFSLKQGETGTLGSRFFGLLRLRRWRECGEQY